MRVAPIRDLLNARRVYLRNYASGEHKTACPRAQQCGRKKVNDPCLSVKIDERGAVLHCHHCDWTDAVKAEGYMPREPKRPIVKPEPPKPRAPDASAMLRFFEARGISKATVERYGIVETVWRMPQFDKPVACIAFPYMRRGDVVNIKYRGPRKSFSQVKDAEKILYGLDDIEGKDECVIVEGEIDKLALAEAGVMNVVSVPDGAPKRARDELPSESDDDKFSYVWNCREYLDPMRRIVLATDADGPGEALAEELARRLGKERCWRVHWPCVGDAQRKDANEVLMEDGPKTLRECVANPDAYPIEGLHTFADFAGTIQNFWAMGERQGVSTGWSSLDGHLKVRPGDLWIITGLPGSGKSEWLDALMINLALKHEWRFGIASMENSVEDHGRKLLEKYVQKPFFSLPYARFRERMSQADVQQGLRWMERYFALIRRDDDNMPTIDFILECARAAVMRYGMRGLIIDPYSELDHLRPENQTETEYVSQTLSKVKRFLQAHEITGFFVAHPRAMRGEERRRVPGLYDISGSAHWWSKADVGITVHRPRDDTGAPSEEVEIHVLKTRSKAAGSTGFVRFDYDVPTGLYTERRLEAAKESDFGADGPNGDLLSSGASPWHN